MLPPTLGFGMFLAYFARNHFYPSFDIFQFSSLLLAAACLGFLTIGAFVAALFLPGAWVYYRFINTAAIKEDITYALPYRTEGRFRKIMLLMTLVFFVPYLLAGFSDAAILFVDPELFVSVALLAPIPITLLAGMAVQWLFDLRRFSFLKFVWEAYLSTMVVGLFIVWMLAQAYPLVSDWQPLLKWDALAIAPFIIAFVTTMTSMLFIAGWKAAMMFSLFFALFLAAIAVCSPLCPRPWSKRWAWGITRPGPSSSIPPIAPRNSPRCCLRPSTACCRMCRWSGRWVRRSYCAWRMAARHGCRPRRFGRW